MSETDWEKRAHEIVAEEFLACRASDKPYWREPDFEIRAALRVGREMAGEERQRLLDEIAWRERAAADARTQEIANAIERAAHPNQDCSCAAIARSFISKPACKPPSADEVYKRFKAQRQRIWDRWNADLESALFDEKPKTREQVLEEALRYYASGHHATQGQPQSEVSPGAVARRALGWEP
jgi:hypothetical protein